MTPLVAALIALAELLIRALLPAVMAGASSTVEDGARQPLLRQKLVERIRSTWGAAAMIILLAMTTGGCTRTVYIPSGEPVRLRETIRNAKVWVLDKDGKPVPGEMDLPEGWYCVAPPEN